MSHKRLWLGLAAMIAVQMVVSNLFMTISPDQIRFIAPQSVLAAFLAALAGGAIARKGFVLPAMGVWLVVWAAITYVLYRIAEPMMQDLMASIIRNNWLAFVLSGVATGIGALLGQWLTAGRARRVAAT